MTTTAAPPRVDVEHEPDEPARPRPLAGVWQLLRLVGRRDRFRIAVWTTAIIGLVVATVASIIGLYDTQAELDQYGQLIVGNAALIVQTGPGYGLSDPTTGSVVMNELSLWTIIAVALMSIFMTVRHTRADEESERAELIRSSPVGRHAPLAATLTAVGATNVLIGAAVSLSLIVYGLPTTGSLAFGVSLVLAGVLFSGVAAVTAQIASNARSAVALGGVVLAASFVVRAVGDVRSSVLSWCSPLGWAQAIRAFADERWWVLVLPLATTVVLVNGAIALQERRDFGAGLLRQRPGPATASPRLGSPFGLAIRLQRATLAGWTAGLAVVGFFYGIVADQAESIIEDNPDMADFFAQLGEASITDAFLATSVLILALTATGFTITSVLRLRSEEAAQRADPVLATPTPRWRWVASHVLVAVGGTIVVMLTTGAALGAGFGLMTGDGGQVPRLAIAALVMVPAMVVVGGVALAACALVPRFALAAWSTLAGVFVIGLFGTVLKMPQWLVAVSPFDHVPAMPAEPFDALPLLLLGLTATAFTASALVGYRRRDIG
ncbi:MAG: hypothetical protein HKN44_01900 [Ilumatobacter sp.]|nr:hypothetical protein [Ilumatobacter sp.]